MLNVKPLDNFLNIEYTLELIYEVQKPTMLNYNFFNLDSPIIIVYKKSEKKTLNFAQASIKYFLNS